MLHQATTQFARSRGFTGRQQVSVRAHQTQKKVSLVAQTLSKRMGEAIDFCRDDLRFVDYIVSEATTDFTLLFDSLFLHYELMEQFWFRPEWPT